MTYYDLYVYEAEDPERASDGDNKDENSTQHGVHISLMGDLFKCIKARRMLESEEYGGKDVDWGSSRAELRKPDVIGFFNEFYKNEKEREEAISKVEGFPNDRIYRVEAVET